MTMRAPVGKYARAKVGHIDAPRLRRERNPRPLPLAEIRHDEIPRSALPDAPLPAPCNSCTLQVVYPPGWAGAESHALPPAAPPRGDPQPPTPLETPVFFDPRYGGVGRIVVIPDCSVGIPPASLRSLGWRLRCAQLPSSLWLAFALCVGCVDRKV